MGLGWHPIYKMENFASHVWNHQPHHLLGEVNQGDHKSGLDMFIIPGPRFKPSGLDLRQLHPIFFLGEASNCSTAMCYPELNLRHLWKFSHFPAVHQWNHHPRSPRCSVLKHFQLSQLSTSRCQSRTLRSNAPLQMRSPRRSSLGGWDVLEQKPPRFYGKF